ncbi:MAG: type II secretion system F family protein [bacterium]|nr:type II secretion system F family protein [bacterium]
MLFAYKAVKKDGMHYEGTLEAADKFALYKQLHEGGNVVLEVKEKGARGVLKAFLSVSFGGAKMADRIMFAKNLSAMLHAGLPLTRALSVLERQMSNKTWTPILKKLTDNLSKGVSLSVSLAEFPKTFSTLFVSMVGAGEESGSLVQSLGIVGEELEKSYELRKKIRGAMMYPAIILCVMIAIAILMLVYVIPKLTLTFKEFNTELPLSTRAIISTSDFFANYYVFIIAGIIASVAFMYAFSKTLIGKHILGRISLKLPIFGTIVQEINSARTTRTLSSLLSSGVEVVTAIKITADVVQNIHYKEMLAKTADEIQKGTSLESIFRPKIELYPPFVAEMIGVGEETGTLPKTLLEVAIFYENEVTQKTKDMSTIIEPFLMVAIGIGVGFFALAMISPIYSLSNNI